MLKLIKRISRVFLVLILAGIVLSPFVMIIDEIIRGAVEVCGEGGCHIVSRKSDSSWLFWLVISIKGLGTLVIIAIAALVGANGKTD